MKKITAQAIRIDGVTLFKPYSLPDEDATSEFKPNQPVQIEIKGFAPVKERSLTQLKLAWAAAAFVASNTDDKHWDTKEKAMFQTQVGLHFVQPNMTIVTPEGNIIFHYRSIAIKNLKHLEACRFFDRAFEFMAAKIGMNVDEFIKAVKSQMKGQHP